MDEWLHVFFTYDGTRSAYGLKIYVNGAAVDTITRRDSLPAKASIRTDAVMQLGRRDDYQPMRETRFQDVRFYRRALSADTVARLPFEDVASEIVARKPDPSTWTTDEAFVVEDRWYLGEVDTVARKLADAVAAHGKALEALTRDGEPTLIAVEKPTPAYADILKRGDYYSRVERVGPGTPHFLPPPPAGAPLDRRGLADWLLSPEQPLFSRVTVNRMWQEVFGTGLVDTPGDFGVMGAKALPSRAPGLARGQVPRERLGREGILPDARDLGHVPAVGVRDAGAALQGSGKPPAFAGTAPADGRRDAP
jgi:hypothetical protein